MKQKAYILFIFLVCFCSKFFGQNKHLTLGFNDNGLSFGNSTKTNGVRLNLWDKDDISVINGLNITTISKARISNGFTFGLLAMDNSVCNGIVINGLAGLGEKANGIIISGLGYSADQFNGLGVGGFGLVGEKLNGLFISPISIGFWNNEEKIKIINGATIGVYFVTTEKLNGVSISIINNNIDKQSGLSIGIVNEIKELNGVTVGVFNKSKKTRGIQIGIWNIIEENKVFKRMPIINFNFRKKTSR